MLNRNLNPALNTNPALYQRHHARAGWGGGRRENRISSLKGQHKRSNKGSVSCAGGGWRSWDGHTHTTLWPYGRKRGSGNRARFLVWGPQTHLGWRWSVSQRHKAVCVCVCVYVHFSGEGAMAFIRLSMGSVTQKTAYRQAAMGSLGGSRSTGSGAQRGEQPRACARMMRGI